MPTVYVKTLGCKVNTYDSRAMESQMRQLGYDILSRDNNANVTILNSCSVTRTAEVEARRLVRRYKRQNPEGFLVVTGCYAQTDSASLLALDEIDLVIPNQGKSELALRVNDEYLRKYAGDLSRKRFPEHFKPVKDNRQNHFNLTLEMIPANLSQTRAFLKIQDGCNGFCTYCIIPYARGASRSVPREQIADEVKRLIKEGVKEIVFTGIHLGDYGKDLGQGYRKFEDLIRELLSWPDMARIRISSLEPGELTEGLLRAFKERPEKFCDHLHLPLQSGDDNILKKMRRSYSTSEYAEKVALARTYFPDINIGADVIPGFPGETDPSFAKTMDFVRNQNLQYVHVFPYSKRSGTPAVKFASHVDPTIIKKRCLELRKLSTRQFFSYKQQFIGRPMEVLWEASLDSCGRRIGKARNFLEIAAATGSQTFQGSLEWVTIKGHLTKGRLIGNPRQK